MDLGPLGVLLTDPVDIAVAVADINGEAEFALSLPDSPIWKGQTLYVQAIFWNGFVGGFSNAVATRICR